MVITIEKFIIGLDCINVKNTRFLKLILSNEAKKMLVLYLFNSGEIYFSLYSYWSLYRHSIIEYR